MEQGLNSKEATDCVQLLILSQLHRCVLDDDLVELVIGQNLVRPVLGRLWGELVVTKDDMELSYWRLIFH